MGEKCIVGSFLSPVGRLWFSIREAGVEELCFSEKEPLIEEGCRDQRLEVWKERLICELSEYFQGRRTEFSVPLNPSGTQFQKQVWKALREIPYGETRSYKEIAEVIGNPKACRAVGMANHKNPLPILVPCHRVIGSDGSLTGYAGGLEIKKKLLCLERGRG